MPVKRGANSALLMVPSKSMVPFDFSSWFHFSEPEDGNFRCSHTVVPRKRQEVPMLYRGIRYDIKVGIGIKQWIWIVHTPKPRQGDSIGSRQRAIYYAEKA